MVSVAIVGGGASGVLAAVNLRRAMGSAATIRLIEKRRDLGRGVAYSTSDPRHLLNVRVSNMSAFPDAPDHFLHWLQRHGRWLGLGDSTRSCFVPRGVYGAYLASLIASDSGRDGIEIVNDECVDIADGTKGVRLTLASGRAFAVDLCILATGDEVRSTRLGSTAVSPWQPGALDGIREDASVLIIGTGLTMVDVAVSLASSGAGRIITAISRRGLRPAAHLSVAASPIARADVPFGAPVSRLTRWLRHLAQECERQGGDWRSAVDGVRPHTAGLWMAMSFDQRRRFLRHARPWWDVHRHRMAPSVAEAVDGLVRHGRLRLVAGRIVACEVTETGVRVSYQRRGDERTEEIDEVARVFDCSGTPGHPQRTTNPAIRALLTRGGARPDALGLGLAVDAGCRLLDVSGDASPRLFAVGSLSRGTFWETVAIPDIRVQCAELAHHIASMWACANRAD